jgi:hypothetical protein
MDKKSKKIQRINKTSKKIYKKNSRKNSKYFEIKNQYGGFWQVGEPTRELNEDERTQWDNLVSTLQSLEPEYFRNKKTRLMVDKNLDKRIKIREELAKLGDDISQRILERDYARWEKWFEDMEEYDIDIFGYARRQNRTLSTPLSEFKKEKPKMKKPEIMPSYIPFQTSAINELLYPFIGDLRKINIGELPVEYIKIIVLNIVTAMYNAIPSEQREGFYLYDGEFTVDNAPEYFMRLLRSKYGYHIPVNEYYTIFSRCLGNISYPFTKWTLSEVNFNSEYIYINSRYQLNISGLNLLREFVRSPHLNNTDYLNFIVHISRLVFFSLSFNIMNFGKIAQYMVNMLNESAERELFILDCKKGVDSYTCGRAIMLLNVGVNDNRIIVFNTISSEDDNIDIGYLFGFKERILNGTLS